MSCSYADGIFEEVTVPLMVTAEQVFTSSKWDGKKIAENDEFTIHLVYVNQGEKCLVMYDKEGKRSSVRNRRLRCAKDLALAMWQFKNLGTIFA